jgi:hypothetical protein
MNEQQAEHVESVPNNDPPDMTGAWLAVGWWWSEKLRDWVLHADVTLSEEMHKRDLQATKNVGIRDIRVLRVPPVAPLPKDNPPDRGAISDCAKAWQSVFHLLCNLTPGWYENQCRTAEQSALATIRELHEEANRQREIAARERSINILDQTARVAEIERLTAEVALLKAGLVPPVKGGGE